MIARRVVRWGACAALASLAACAAPETRFERPSGDAPPLAGAADTRIEVRIEAMLAPNVKGAWMQDAYWDEYLFTVRALDEVAVTVTDVALIDALGHRLPTRADRTGLAETTSETARRYEGSKQVARDESGHWMLAGGTIGIATGTAIAAGTALGSFMSMTAASTPAAAGFFAVGGVLMAFVGIHHAATNSAIQAALTERQTRLPAEARRDAPARLDLFFPVTPLPDRVEVRYTAAGKRHRLFIDTREAFALAHR